MSNMLRYEQPFSSGTVGCNRFRIPAILTLNDSTVLAAADLRYNNGADSPNNLDTLVAKSQDGYSGWTYSKVNYFDDYADDITDKASASFIDAALVQSKKTDRIFIITDAWTSNGGYPTAKKGSGYAYIDGIRRLLLTKGSTRDEIETFEYYLGDFNDGFADVFLLQGDEKTAYSVDSEYNLYKSGELLYQKQVGSDKMVAQKIFYEEADLKLYCTCYLWLRYSDDNGKTWSSPKIISESVKSDKEAFLGICPGRGICFDYENKERIMFCVYDNTLSQERVSTIYSDDNGETWHRGKPTDVKKAVKKTSESQLVMLNNGVVRIYARNAYDYVAYADSTDGGVTFDKFKADTELSCRKNCMVSFINLKREIGGKPAIIGSYPYNTYSRSDGMLKVGVVEDNNEVTWISEYHVNEGPYAYSCLTELENGEIGLLYEDSDFSIRYIILDMDENGVLSLVSGKDIDYKGKLSVAHTIINVFKKLKFKINKCLDLV